MGWQVHLVWTAREIWDEVRPRGRHLGMWRKLASRDCDRHGRRVVHFRGRVAVHDGWRSAVDDWDANSLRACSDGHLGGEGVAWERVRAAGGGIGAPKKGARGDMGMAVRAVHVYSVGSKSLIGSRSEVGALRGSVKFSLGGG